MNLSIVITPQKKDAYIVHVGDAIRFPGVDFSNQPLFIDAVRYERVPDATLELRYLSVRIPGGARWSGRGTTSYVGARSVVVRINRLGNLSDKHEWHGSGESIFDIPVRFKGE